MQLLWETVLTLLIALALTIAGWVVLGRILGPAHGTGVRIVVHGRDAGENLEQAVRWAQWLRGWGLISCPVTIADAGLNAEGRELALRLTASFPEVTLWPAERLEELKRQI